MQANHHISTYLEPSYSSHLHHIGNGTTEILCCEDENDLKRAVIKYLYFVIKSTFCASTLYENLKQLN